VPYKETDAATFKGISRQILFSEEELSAELRYFEIQPGGYSTLERHEHVHGVVIVRGNGRCLVGGEVKPIAPFDLIRIPAWTWHQFRPLPGETLGFLCMVNASRDRPVLPTEHELMAMKTDPAVAAFLDS
jgi:quercetin dioxygenase-like cupin family protein